MRLIDLFDGGSSDGRGACGASRPAKARSIAGALKQRSRRIDMGLRSADVARGARVGPSSAVRRLVSTPGISRVEPDRRAPKALYIARNIPRNCVLPTPLGLLHPNKVCMSLFAGDGAQQRASLSKSVPMLPMGDARDGMHAALSCAFDEATHVIGEAMSVDACVTCALRH